MSHGWPLDGGAGHGDVFEDLVARMNSGGPTATNTGNSDVDHPIQSYHRPSNQPATTPFQENLYSRQEDTTVSPDFFDRGPAPVLSSNDTFNPSNFRFPSSPLFVPSQPLAPSRVLHNQLPLDLPRPGPTTRSAPDFLPSSNLNPSPSTRHIIQSDEPTHRLRALHQPSQQQELTPPLHSVSYNYQPTTTSYHSSPDLENSSPAERASNRRKLSQNALQALQQQSLKSNGSSLLELSHAPPMASGIHLISPRNTLPDKFQSVFPYDLFNAVQSKCFSSVYKSNDNVVVSAPTGSGKTAIMELAICKLAHDRGDDGYKIVYQAPTKALCNERSRDWAHKFSHMNLQVAELTGDTSAAEMQRVGSASIIVTTPEKWDSVTRKWTDHRKLLHMVELFLIDEVHILKDTRGATLEAVVSRMKTIGTKVRFIALSATVPNSDDIAKWLGRGDGDSQLPARRETFSEDLRPVKLKKYVYGYDSNGNDFIFDNYLDQKLPVILSKHAEQKPIIIFCFTRKSCETTAQRLAELWSVALSDEKLWPAPSKRIPVVSHELQDIVRYGVAFHHAGLDVQDRNAVEQAFLGGDLHVICCTTTLAVGVNLPCHTVVLKGTSGYQDGKLSEYSDLEVMQMLGRAGRPQFDDSATAIILTRSHNKDRYDRMISGQQVLESTLHLNLIEHLNSEIVLQTIRDPQSAKTWLNGTFLSVRLRQNPAYYRLTKDSTHSQAVDDRLEEICSRDIMLLQEANLVTRDKSFSSTEYGKAMAKYMIQFETMKKIVQINRGVKMEALAEEFKEFKLKANERALYREFNKSPFIMYPIRETVTTTAHKISLLVQVHLGGVDIPTGKDYVNMGRQIALEKILVFERMQRLVRCVGDCKGDDLDAVGSRTALELSRALASDSWEGRPTQLRQVPGIGPVAMRKLLNGGVLTVHQLAEKDYTDIERILSRNPPYGKTLHDTLSKFPVLVLEAHILGRAKNNLGSHGRPTVNVKAIVSYSNTNGIPIWQDKSPCVSFTAESTSGTLAYFWRGSLRKLKRNGADGSELFFQVNLTDYEDEILCQLSCDEIVGTIVSKTLRHGLSKSAFPAQPVTSDRTNADATPHNLDSTQDFDDGLSDDALIEVTEQLSHRNRQSPCALLENAPVDEDDEYPYVGELLQAATPESSTSSALSQEHGRNERDFLHAPVQLPNGRWKCNHACSNGQLTKAGKPCTHRCCHEGLDKPRKYRPPAKSKQDQDGEHGVNHGVDATSPQKENQPNKEDLASSKGIKTCKRDIILGPDSTVPMKRKHHDSIGSTSTTIDGIDCIDLTNVDDFNFSSDDFAVHGQADVGHSQRVKSGERHLESAAKNETRNDTASEQDEYGGDPFGDTDLADFEVLQPKEHKTSLSETRGLEFGDGQVAVDASRTQMSPHSNKKAMHEASKLLDLPTSFTSNEEEKQEPDSDANVWVSRASWPLPAEDDMSMFKDDPEASNPAPGSLFDVRDDKDNHQEGKTKMEEPEWVNDFDEDFVKQFRGIVNFI